MSNERNHMISITILALVMSAALVKLGAATTTVNLLSIALQAALACIGALIAALILLSRRQPT